MSLKCAPVLQKIKEKVAAADPDPSKRKALHAYTINITQNGTLVKQYTMDLKTLKTYEGPYADGTPDVVITIEDEALALIGAKQMTDEQAMAKGMLKMDGDPVAISKFDLLKEKLEQ